MDKTAVFLRIRALTHAHDMIFSNADDGLSEDANTISMMLVELVDKYDRMRTAEAEERRASEERRHKPPLFLFPARYSRLNRSLMLCRYPFPVRASGASCGL